MLKKILVLIAVTVAVILGIASTKPDTFKISRDVVIAAPPSVIYKRINSLTKWLEWSPYAKRDPNQTTTYEGPAAGVGARMTWAGNSDVGKGAMTIVDSVPDSVVGLKLEFEKPMTATNRAEFTLAPDPAGTKVTWSMTGNNNMLSKVISLFLDMDKLIGADFETGLASLKTVSEVPAQ